MGRGVNQVALELHGLIFFYHYDGHYKTFNKIYTQTVKLISINISAKIIILHKARWAITVLLFQTTQAKTNIIDSHDDIMYVNKHYYKLDDNNIQLLLQKGMRTVRSRYKNYIKLCL